MNQPFITIIIIAFITGFSSCKKEGVDVVIGNVKAGVYNSDYIYYKYPTPLEIQIIWDSIGLYGEGKDSIDFDLDGIYDLEIILSHLNHDSLHLLQGAEPMSVSGCRFISLSDVEVMNYREVAYIGLGSTVDVHWVDTLAFNAPINSSHTWSSDPYCSLWREKHLSVAILRSNGGWFYLNSIRYVGFRMDGNYGWLAVDASDPYSPKFIEYAILNE